MGRAVRDRDCGMPSHAALHAHGDAVQRMVHQRSFTSGRDRTFADG